MRQDLRNSRECQEQHEVPDLAGLDGSSHGALMIRHGARHGTDVALHTDGLTPEGREQARKLGRRIGERKRIRLFASPVQRCVDTASLIAEGANSDPEVTISTMLGRPGTFVIDETAVDERLAVMGLNKFAVEWAHGRIPAKVMAPIPQGTQALMDWVQGNMRSNDDRLDIYVGHDLFLTPVLVNYLGYDIASQGLLSFLDGFTVTMEGSRTVLSYGGKRTVI